MVIVAGAVAKGQPPDAAIVLVTVQVPGAEADKSTCPVVVLTKVKPAGVAVKVPALPPPLNVGEGSAAFWQ